MALDWNKEIHFSDLFKRKAGGSGKADVPFKTSMNLYQPRHDAQGGIGKTLLVGLLLAVGVAAFAKFGVVDQLARVDEAQARLAQTETAVAALEAQLTDYAEIEDEFLSITTQFMSDDVDLNDVLDLVENFVMMYADVTNISVSDNVVTLEFTNVSLDMVGTIARGVNTYPLVRSVNVSTAASQEDVTKVSATMTIELITTSDTVDEVVGETSQSDLFSGLDTDGHSLVLNDN